MESSSQGIELQRLAEHGIQLCREGDWDQGLPVLVQIAESGQNTSKLPGRFFSYLGYGVAYSRRQVADGIRLCQKSVKLEFYQPENYLNLARVHLLNNDKERALEAIQGGLKVDPSSRALQKLRTDHFGERRRPPIPGLSRGNILNRILGYIRHLSRGPERQDPSARARLEKPGAAEDAEEVIQAP